MNTLEFRFAFFSRNFDKSVHFYQDFLGLGYLAGWDRPDGKGALLSVSGNAVIEIYGAAQGESYEGPVPQAINLALQLENTQAVEECYTRLTRMGANLSGPPEHRAWGHYSFIVYDPDQIPIHLYCEVASN